MSEGRNTKIEKNPKRAKKPLKKGKNTKTFFSLYIYL